MDPTCLGLTLSFDLVAEAVGGDQGREGVRKTVRSFLGNIDTLSAFSLCSVGLCVNLAFLRKLFFFLCISAGHFVKNCYSMTAHRQPERLSCPRYLLNPAQTEGSVENKGSIQYLEQSSDQAAVLIHKNKSWPQCRSISLSSPRLTIRNRRSHPHHSISPSVCRICNSADSSNDPQIAPEETNPDRSDFQFRAYKTRRSCLLHRSP